MATTVTMPKMGFDMVEGKLLRWLKKVGEPVKAGEPLAEIETEKVNIEFEAPASGVLKAVLIEEGTTVPVGTPIAIIAAPDELVEAPATAPAVREGPPLPTPAPGTPPPPAPAPAPVGAPTPPPGGRVKASPLARRLAREAGIDLREISGTGPGGRVVKRDVDRYLQARTPAAAPPPPAAAPIPTPVPAPVPTPAPTAVPVNPLRQAIARRMTASKQTAPHFYVTVEVDMDEAMAWRARINEALGERGKVTVNDMVVKAAALALREFPALRSSYQEGGIVRHEAIHIGIAVALEEGLITVVLRDADRKPLAQIARESKELVERARSGKVRPEDIEGSVFTVSNLGMFDVEHFIAIINPPEAAIMAVGSVREVPVVKNGQLAIGQRMKVTVSADHRVTDGAEVARFLQVFRRYLENPLLLLVE
ncbi:dihydrolipoamide acetyltransferase family protein [Thermoflexus hugenholtzii]|uniref:Dihydrolipoamide acetyltransferase component of pyruvate dehydrogenase complex n=1 Tax=Thermoflexus hugenholtzii JAD2 TaxID=877466 RepID=A0A212R1G5_9CHLR|nr:dihydrolipoamide acetyltransferase family protein [Thermoflexus hugenholtzii]SNB65853.1 pyruvate dehydrogenase E2 component (dihydrolipoamide acetyltransferase) [Thermoflexus hugenholtzii JAD2]